MEPDQQPQIEIDQFQEQQQQDLDLQQQSIDNPHTQDPTNMFNENNNINMNNPPMEFIQEEDPKTSTYRNTYRDYMDQINEINPKFDSPSQIYQSNPQQSSQHPSSHRKHKLSKSMSKFDLIGQHFHYAQIEFRDPQQFSTYAFKSLQNPKLNLGEHGTTQVNFRKERQRINADTLFHRFQQWFPSYQSNNNQKTQSIKQQPQIKNELEKGYQFRLSREQVKFGQIPIKNTPGVGKYNIFQQKNNDYQFSFGKRTPNPIYNKQMIKNPGPGYYQTIGSINQEGVYNVDKFKNSHAQAFAPPDENRFIKIKSTPKLGPGTYQYESINQQGQYRQDKLKRATGGKWSQTNRFIKPPDRVMTPGPGAYRIYKDVQNEPKKVKQRLKKEQEKQIKQQNRSKPINLNSSSLINNSHTNSKFMRSSNNQTDFNNMSGSNFINNSPLMAHDQLKH